MELNLKIHQEHKGPEEDLKFYDHLKHNSPIL